MSDVKSGVVFDGRYRCFPLSARFVMGRVQLCISSLELVCKYVDTP